MNVCKQNPYVEPSNQCPISTIPNFCSEDPREFAQFKIALENLLLRLQNVSNVHILVDHLKQENALKELNTYAILDDGSKRTMLLYEAARQLDLPLHRTFHHWKSFHSQITEPHKAHIPCCCKINTDTCKICLFLHCSRLNHIYLLAQITHITATEPV